MREGSMNQYNEEFWTLIDRLTGDSEIIIDRPKGTAHPKFNDLIYPVDYGYLKNTASMDGGGIDVWVGTNSKKRASAVICTVDIMKKDSEIKILIGCTEEEIDSIYEFHNNSEYMKGILLKR